MTRRGAEALLALLFVPAILVVGGAALFFFLTITPVHTDPATVPSSTAIAQRGRYSDAIEHSRRMARTIAVDEKLPALSVAVAVDGEMIWAEAFGWADIERREPATPRTRFRLGSVSKTLTAAAVGVLHERGRVDLDAPVQTYLRAYPRKKWTVTTRQLMGDVAGVHVIRGDNNDSLPDRECTSLDEAMTIVAREPLLFEPGTNYRFSTNGWILVSAVVESAAGEPFATFMTRDVLTPLGMESTVLEADERLPDTTSFYFPRAGLNTKWGVEEAARRNNSCLFGAGAYLSTPSDLAHFGSAMLKPGFLTADTIDLLQTPLRLESGESTDFALGWKVERVQLNGESTRMVAHRARPMGGTAALLMFPDQRLVIAAISNVTGATGVAPFGVKVAEAFMTRASRSTAAVRTAPPRSGLGAACRIAAC
jgi:CubicO group peptidase (beta-lactamase class C family)